MAFINKDVIFLSSIFFMHIHALLKMSFFVDNGHLLCCSDTYCEVIILILLTHFTGSKWLKTCLLRQCSNFSEANWCFEGFAKLLWSLQFECAPGHTLLEVLIVYSRKHVCNLETFLFDFPRPLWLLFGIEDIYAYY